MIDIRLPQEEFKKQLEKLYDNGASFDELFHEAFRYVVLREVQGIDDPSYVRMGDYVIHFDTSKLLEE
jgi:hypothetical protein